MTVPAGNENVVTGDSGQQVEGQPVDNAQQQSEQGSGINPAWNELFSVLPTSLQPLVTPHLQKWETNSQQAIQKATEQYQPWQPLAEKYNPEMVQGLLQLIESDPQQLIDTLIEFHGLTPKEAQQVAQQTQGTNPADVLDIDSIGQAPDQQADIESHPKFLEMKQQVEQLTGYFQQQAQQQINAQANAEIDSELAALKAKHGEINEQALFAFAQTIPNLTSLEQAYDAMDAYNKSILQGSPSRNAPPVLPSFGGAPSGQQIDVKTLKPGERKSLVTQILERAHAEN